MFRWIPYMSVKIFGNSVLFLLFSFFYQTTFVTLIRLDTNLMEKVKLNQYIGRQTETGATAYIYMRTQCNV